MSLGKKVELIHAGNIKSIRAEALGVNRKNIYKKSIQRGKDEVLKQDIERVWIQTLM